MQTRNLRLALVFFLTLAVCASTRAQVAGRIESMKLLTPDTGWAATGKKLFWTTDGGSSWKDITPKLNHKRQMVSSVFFLDPSTGWVLLSCGDDKDALIDDVCFEFALTADAGENWSITHPKITDPVPPSVVTEDGQGYSGTTYLDFADAQHGWAILKRNLHVEASSGVMLRTLDGGHTWTQLPKDTLPIADDFLFATARDGWMAGGPDEDLYRTHDAGDSWQAVSLAVPAQISQDLSPVYNLPVFVGEKIGYLRATYASSMSSGVLAAVFKTEDGGTTWHSLIVTGTLPDTHPWAAYPSAIAKGELLTATISGGQIDLSHTEQGAEMRHQSAKISVHASTVDQLSFVSPLRGWVLATYWILSTSDGGVSWTDVTPEPSGTVPRLASSRPGGTKTATAAEKAAGPDSASASNSGSTSTHLGFDTWPTPTTAAMQAWSTSSPYYDAYIYLYGSPNKSTKKSLYASQPWLSTVEGYGWGIVPVWFGLQSTCVNDASGITQFISTDPTTASTQGADQADSAVGSDQALGISAGIIYFDIESYKVGGTCSAAVQSYVDGFVTEIHNAYQGYQVGVYATPAAIGSDISNQNVAQADAIWIANPPTKKNPYPQVTIWNQGFNDALWPNGQRVHQFLMNQSTTFGNSTIKIDPDVDNGPVLNANAIAKSYTYSAANITCPGAISTIPTAVNDMNGTTFINGPGQMGTAVGTYQTSLTSPLYAYQDSGGTCTAFSVFSSASVEPWGINNLGQIVGWFEDSSGDYHGFILSSSGTATQIDYPGGGQTYLFGINDAGQAVGYAYSPGTFGYQSFMYYGGQYYPLGVSGGGNFDYTLAFGINGQGTITGVYYFEPFTEDFELPVTPSVSGTTVTWGGVLTAITPGGTANTAAKGINANDEMAGFYYSSSCGNTVSECGFEWSGGFLLTILAYGTDANVVEGINDFAQVVGPYTDSITGYSGGLLWSHQ